MNNSLLLRRTVAEFIGTLFLLAAVVGSGIMGERLAAGNVALALLANTIATGAALIAIILTFGPISGAHLNPASNAREPLAEKYGPERSRGLYPRADIRGIGRSGHSALNVRFTDIFGIGTRTRRFRSTT